MKFKFMKVTILALVMCVSSVAQAGLIIGNQEFLDLGLTTEKTNAQIEAMISTDNTLSGYSLATDVDAAMLYNLIPGASHTDTGYHAIDYASSSSTSQAVMNFFAAGYLKTYNLAEIRTDTHGIDFTRNGISSGYLRYMNAGDSSDNQTGYFEVLHYNLTVTGFFNWAGRPDVNLADTTASLGDWASRSDEEIHSLYVRTIDVPEPSTIAIFALGMIGLASRRFKKQS